MEGVEFNPGNPAEYNDFVPEVEKKRTNTLLWSAAIILAGIGIYKLYKSYTNNTNKHSIDKAEEISKD
ncbi:MAG: hypothetical protein JXB49_02160 [Bacteroidales bacterium]|nr:hypothetical protein [Bacteroidales bacterium]